MWVTNQRQYSLDQSRSLRNLKQQKRLVLASLVQLGCSLMDIICRLRRACVSRH